MNDNIIYFDNSATTPLCDEAIEKMEYVMRGIYGNPSSLHTLGLEAEHVQSEGRASVLSALFAGKRANGSLIFCASGTEANNLALLGAVRAKKLRGNPRIITDNSEHPSVLNTLEQASARGVEIVKISTRAGMIDLSELKKTLTPETLLLSLMLVNNETGARYAVEKAIAAARTVNPQILAHVDAVQGFLKVPFTPSSLGADMVTVSSHKIHGPKGVGALWVSDPVLRSKRLAPVIFGGGQEGGLRSGTENVIGIAGFAAAASRGIASLNADIVKLRRLRLLIEENADSEVRFNTPDGEYAPHIISLTLPSIKSETMLHYLSGQDICVSSGSACAAHSGKANYVLAGFGLTPREADCTIRVSLSAMNTEEEALRFCEALHEGISTLIRIK